jgi:hypothetical protein
MASSHTTTDHDEIRTWAEQHGGRPVKVETKGGKGKEDHGGVLRIDFQEKDANFTDIEWDEWFEIFEESNLALLVGEGDSRFNKLIAREGSPRGK